MHSVELPEFDVIAEKFVDKVSMFYGDTGTGKSVMMRHVLACLKQHIEQIIVISPTDAQNHTYSDGTVPIPFIHEVITETLLSDIWERQSAFVNVYKKANDPATLLKLFNRIPNIMSTKVCIAEVINRLDAFKKDMEDSGEAPHLITNKINEKTDICHQFIRNIYRTVIDRNRAKLESMNLSENERWTLKYINFNPSLLLIFDDCTDQLKKFRSNQILQKLFYQGRWSKITCLIACHTDKALDPELKKNARINVFTDTSSATSYFARQSNFFDPILKSEATRAITSAFTSSEPHQKLIWVKAEKMFYRATAKVHKNLSFGSPIIREFAEKVQTNTHTLDNNRFISQFK